MMYYFNDFFFAPLLMIGFWVLIVWGIVNFVKSILQTSSEDGHNRAEKILKERYTKGEITREQFETMKKDIQ